MNMKQLTLKEQSLILGGDYDEEKCKEVQKKADELSDKQDKGENVKGEDWDAWIDEYFEYCN